MSLTTDKIQKIIDAIPETEEMLSVKDELSIIKSDIESEIIVDDEDALIDVYYILLAEFNTPIEDWHFTVSSIWLDIPESQVREKVQEGWRLFK